MHERASVWAHHIILVAAQLWSVISKGGNTCASRAKVLAGVRGLGGSFEMDGNTQQSAAVSQL